MDGAVIALRGVHKRYAGKDRGAGHTALADVSLEAARGSLMVLLGRSGCGKTTTLRLIAGLDAPDAGEIWLGAQCVAGGGSWVPPETRRIGMVFQDYALFPHLTARGNVAFALEAGGSGRSDRNRRDRAVDDALTRVGLEHKGASYPHQLSGGEQQRVALARALAPGPSVLLLDEPFSNLDAALRREVRGELRRIVKSAGVTAMFVTHDREEALSIADSVAVMCNGRILQVGAPQVIYLRPADREVAELVGEVNLLPGRADGLQVSCALGTLPLAWPMRGPVEVMVRPEAIRLKPDAQGCACVDQLVFFGHDQDVLIRLTDGRPLRARALAHAPFVPGMACGLEVVGPVVAYEPRGRA